MGGPIQSIAVGIGGTIFVTLDTASEIYVLDVQGRGIVRTMSLSPLDPNAATNPIRLRVLPDGRLVAASQRQRRVYVFDPGASSPLFSTAPTTPAGTAAEPSGVAGY